MAKDPAFLFYPGDWLGGTMGMTLEEKGAYLELLIMQWNCGRIANDAAIRLVGEKLWHKLSHKFLADGSGLFNKRLEHEKEKRKKHSEKQSDNAKKRWQKSQSGGIADAMPLENENRNENEIGNGIKEGVAGEEKFIVPKMCKIWYDTFPSYSGDKKSDFAAMGNILWFIAKQHHLRQVGEPETQEKILATLQQVANEVLKDNFWVNKSLKSISSHIQEFYNKIKNPTNGESTSTQKRNGYHSKTAGQDVFADRLKNKLSNLKSQ